MSLNTFNHFDHSRSSTVWIFPETTPDNAIQDLYTALLAAFPDCDDLSNDPTRGITSLTPHLSVGQWKNKLAAEQAAQELATSWTPIEFDVTEIALISRKGSNDPFTLRYKVQLLGGSCNGSGSQPAIAMEADEKYLVEQPPGKPRTGTQKSTKRGNRNDICCE